MPCFLLLKEELFHYRALALHFPLAQRAACGRFSICFGRFFSFVNTIHLYLPFFFAVLELIPIFAPRFDSKDYF
jgi:hypothetical protein